MQLSYTPEQNAFRAEVRAWLQANAPRSPLASYDTREGFEQHRQWEACLARGGWSSVTWPKELGGRGSDLVEWLIFEEEYARADCPLRINQNGILLLGPTLMEFGTTAQKERFLPRMARCDDMWAQGWSEPNAGSDMANISSRALLNAAGDHYVLNGQKTWSTRAVFANWLFGLFRSDPHSSRHHGLSYLLVPLDAPGITIRPIINLAGRHDWNEVTFSDCFIPEECLIGSEGDGWLQVTSELAFERSGPERFMQNYYVLGELVRILGRQPAGRAASILGRLVARLWTLRQMSVAVAGMMQGGKSPAIEASLVKDLGTIYQQDLPEIARVVAESDATTEEDMADFLDVAQYATMMAPSYTIQGGTTQVLRGIVARGLGLR